MANKEVVLELVENLIRIVDNFIVLFPVDGALKSGTFSPNLIFFVGIFNFYYFYFKGSIIISRLN